MINNEEIYMKKTFSLFLTALVLTVSYSSTTALAHNEQGPTYSQTQTIMKPTKEEIKKRFEQRLNLTEKQKEKAKLIHQQGRQQIRPIMMQIAVKRQEIETVKLSRISEKMQQERINQLNIEIKELEKQADEIRKKNTQEFEKILNKKQKAELEQMKAEGRARFARKHPPRPPFQGLGTPNFILKPILPPPPPGNNNNNFWK